MNALVRDSQGKNSQHNELQDDDSPRENLEDMGSYSKNSGSNDSWAEDESP
jgi:hypothetical protein